jgi:hypothetical protein
MEISHPKKALVRTPSLAGYPDVVTGKKVGELTAGRYLLLHFFTGGCINCIHLLAELERVDIPESMAVVGIHTGKFDREKERAWVRRLTERLGIDHPVVNDPDAKLWESFAVRAWPTLVLVSPDGYEIARASGEGSAEEILARFYAYSQEAELERLREKAVKSGSAVRAFSKVHADERHLYLSDIGEGAVHVCTLHGRIFETVEGFAEPQGLFAKEGKLYVADRAAGRILSVDLHDFSVRTLAEGLRSPTGITGDETGLQIAVAGSHQIWRMGYDGRGLEVMAGLGAEGVREGGALTEALFAQPTDLDWLDDVLYVIDAEGSALRAIENGRVTTPIGWDLFTFGDRDGIGDEVRLQHPEGLCAGVGGCGNHRIFICDTYNGKVKVYDPLNGRVTTLMAGLRDPVGLCKAGCFLYVTELGAASVVRFDISTMRKERMKIE